MKRVITVNRDFGVSGSNSYNEEVKNLLFGELDHTIERASSYQYAGKQVRLCLLP